MHINTFSRFNTNCYVSYSLPNLLEHRIADQSWDWIEKSQQIPAHPIPHQYYIMLEKRGPNYHHLIKIFFFLIDHSLIWRFSRQEKSRDTYNSPITLLIMDWNSSSMYSRVGKGTIFMLEGRNCVHDCWSREVFEVNSLSSLTILVFSCWATNIMKESKTCCSCNEKQKLNSSSQHIFNWRNITVKSVHS